MIFVKNISGQTKSFRGVQLDDGEYYHIPSTDLADWYEDQDIYPEITNDNLKVATSDDGSGDIDDYSLQIKYLGNDIPHKVEIDAINDQTFTVHPFNHNVSLGTMPGHKRGSSFGYNLSVGSSFETIWSKSSVYVIKDTAVKLDVKSSVSSDTDTTGSGARKVYIEGLDANFNEIAEVVSLNGTTNVQTMQDFMRVNNAFVLEAGPNGFNDGNVTINHTGDTISHIKSGDGQQHQVIFTVPAGKVALITNGMFTYDKSVRCTARVVISHPDGHKRSIFQIHTSGEPIFYKTNNPFPIPEKYMFYVEAKSNSGSPDCSAGLEYTIMDVTP